MIVEHKYKLDLPKIGSFWRRRGNFYAWTYSGQQIHSIKVVEISTLAKEFIIVWRSVLKVTIEGETIYTLESAQVMSADYFLQAFEPFVEEI
jgi:hypothetical protein